MTWPKYDLCGFVPESQNSLATPGLFNGSPHHSIFGGGHRELPPLSHLDLAGLVLPVGVVRVQVLGGGSRRLVVCRLWWLSSLGEKSKRVEWARLTNIWGSIPCELAAYAKADSFYWN